MKYDKNVDEWFDAGRGFRLSCCGCHLVHDLEFRIKGDKIEVRIFRNERATAAMRRPHKRRVIIVDE
jgi:hypothetical protein